MGAALGSIFHISRQHISRKDICAEKSLSSGTKGREPRTGIRLWGRQGWDMRVTSAQEGAKKALDNYVLVDRGVQRQEDPLLPPAGDSEYPARCYQSPGELGMREEGR